MSGEKPIIVHGLDLSYFTGKAEAYLRAKGLPYRLEEMTTGSFRRLGQRTGVLQMPQLEMPDGSWLTDTPRIIDWFEAHQSEPSITPNDETARFIANLLEDYGDEWLWRPALHYRWAFKDDARLMSGRLARGMLRDVPAPFFLRRQVILSRQRRRFLFEDGYTRETAPATERLYLDTLDALEQVFAARPFLQGERPTRADFGFFGSMFRHFASDPTPSAIMRARAPRTWAWVARLWAIEPKHFAAAPMPQGVADALAPMARKIAGDFLPYMAANADALAAGARFVSWNSDGERFRTPVNPYRVWRYGRTIAAFAALSDNARAAVRDWLGDSALLERAVPAIEPSPSLRDREWRVV